MPCHSTSLRAILKLTAHPCLGITSSLLLSGFPNKFCAEFASILCMLRAIPISSLTILISDEAGNKYQISQYTNKVFFPTLHSNSSHEKSPVLITAMLYLMYLFQYSQSLCIEPTGLLQSYTTHSFLLSSAPFLIQPHSKQC